jgi:drug/metabolite transporter (DMT)-like permease
MKSLHRDDIIGILWAVCASFFVAIMIGIVRKTSQDLHVTQILMMRCFFALLLLTPLIIKTNGKVFQTKQFGLHFLRSISGFIAMLSWFYVVTKISLPEAVSITFIVPILTTLAAMIFLKENVTKKLCLALLLGFAGVMIIIRPGFNDIVIAHYISLLSTILWSFSNILTKKLTKTDKPETVVLYISILILIMSIPASAPYLKSMNFEQLIWLFFLGLSANLAHFSLSIAYGKTDLTTLQPFDFSRLIFISLIAYFAFGELVDIYMVIGSVIIILTSIYLTSGKKLVK